MMIEVYRLGFLFTAGYFLGDLSALEEKDGPVDLWPILLSITLWPVFWIVSSLPWLVDTDSDDDDDFRSA